MAQAPQRTPGSDRPVEPGSDLTVLNAIRQYKKEAEDAKRTRMRKNETNREVYMGIQDWSHKQPGQSTEFLPKTPVAVEQLAAFIKRALVQFGDWFSVDLGKDGNFPLDSNQVRSLLMCYLQNLANGMNQTTAFESQMSDAIKLGALESLIVFKIHGFRVTERQFFAERGLRLVEVDGERRGVEASELKTREIQPWRLAIDLISPSDWFPDPTGRGLYQIHTVEKDFHEVVELAEQGIYDAEAVEGIEEDFAQQEKDWEEAKKQGQDVEHPPGFRKRVVIDEFWGDVLDQDGNLVMRNALAAMANERFLIRKPEPNPWWHQESPFVAAPIVRVPGSVWHKALYDHASPLNIALNELFNLMLDGGLASVWGIKQVRTGGLEDPRQISGGIPQGITLAVKDEFPQNAKVVETVAEGQVPQDALAMFNLADREFNAAALTNDLKMGLLPPKQVKATEVVEIQQSQAVTLDGLASDMETDLIAPTIRKAWLAILQNADNLATEEVADAIGLRGAVMLSRMSPAERFAMMANRCSFKVHGLTSTLARVRDFQKFSALAQMAATNPILFEAFVRRFSEDKILAHLLKSLNINPENLELTDEERQQVPDREQRLMQLMQTMGQGGRGGSVQQETTGGEPELPAEINQNINPLTGLQG